MKIRKLQKMYDSRVVLKIDEFDFEKGKIYAVVGANGCGKSTFLKLLSHTVKSDDKSSEIDFDNQLVCYMPQKNYAFKTSTLKNVLLGSKNAKADTPQAFKLMRDMKIDHLAKQQASRLSGGETARMALCRIILTAAPVILLDEPTAAMDIESTLLSENLIRNYREKTGATIIMVTHSINQAKRLADEVIFMESGHIAEHGPTNDVLCNPQEKKTKEFLEFFSAEI